MSQTAGRREFLQTTAAVLGASAWPAPSERAAPGQRGGAVQLSKQHLAAINRQRRIVFNYDVISGDPSFGGTDPAKLVEQKFHFLDLPGSQIDSVWWCWGEGHQAPWPSKTMPLYDADGYRHWLRNGVDIVQVFLDAATKRGIESFYNYRINGSDNDLGPVSKIPMKEKHPDWLIHTWNANGYFNFAKAGVRAYKLDILREIAERYDFDGIALDFARIPIVLPPGQAWELRDKLTEFLRSVREMTQRVATRRGRPLLLGARLPENLTGCHFDGIDIEAWIRAGLLDVLAPGVRSFDVDLGAFHHLVAGTPVKLYPCLDDHHASDGYQTPPIEIYRGVATNWHQQGADGIQVFNFAHNPRFPWGPGVATIHAQAFRELGEPATLRRQDKTFVVQRRGGGHGTTVIPNPEDWTTPRLMYFNTNMFAPLPALLANNGKVDTLLFVEVGDDLSRDAKQIASLTLRLLLSDSAAAKLSAAQRLDRVTIARIGHPGGRLINEPPPRGIEQQIELRVNNVLLKQPTVESGWLVCRPQPAQFAVGRNLIGVRVTSRPPDARDSIQIEKLEVHVRYRHSA